MAWPAMASIAIPIAAAFPSDGAMVGAWKIAKCVTDGRIKCRPVPLITGIWASEGVRTKGAQSCLEGPLVALLIPETEGDHDRSFPTFPTTSAGQAITDISAFAKPWHHDRWSQWARPMASCLTEQPSREELREGFGGVLAGEN